MIYLVPVTDKAVDTEYKRAIKYHIVWKEKLRFLIIVRSSETIGEGSYEITDCAPYSVL